MSNPKDRLTIVNEALVGPSNRAVENPLDFHPMTRRSWAGMQDTIRFVLGTYHAYFDNGLGSAGLINYSDLSQLFFPDPVGLVRAILEAQVRDIVLTLDSEGDTFSRTMLGDWIQSPSITLAYDARAWNEYQNINPQAQSYLQPLTTYTQYFVGGYDLPVAGPPWQTNNVPGIWPPSRNINSHYDHTSVFLLPALDGEEVSIRSEYNFYADGSPPYEDAVANPIVREHILPNGYMYQAELNNTGTLLLTNDHRLALTIDGTVDWFVTPASAPMEGHLTEDASKDYFRLYSQGLSGLLDMSPNAPGGLNEKTQTLVANKNLVILNSDIALTNADYYNPLAPFGVKITLNNDPNRIQEYVLAQLDDDFVDLLQMQAIESMLQDTPYGAFLVEHREYTDPADPTVVSLEVKNEYNYGLYYVEDILDGWNRFGVPARFEETRANNGTEDYTLLRDWSRSNLSPPTTQTLPTSPAYPPSYDQVSREGEIDLQEQTPDIVRDYNHILANTPCHTETLLYVIEKRRVIPDRGGPVTVAQPAQRIFISPRFDDTQNPLVYYDTQVKYNQRYTYDIRKIAIVFGNEYSYGPADFGYSFDASNDTTTNPPPAGGQFRPDLPPISGESPPDSGQSPPGSNRLPPGFIYEDYGTFPSPSPRGSGPSDLQDDDETPSPPTQPGGSGGLTLDTSLKPHTANPQGARQLNLPASPPSSGSGSSKK